MNKNVLPGAPLAEMEIYFVGRDCYDCLSHHDRVDVYQKVQIELKNKAKKEFLVSMTVVYATYAYRVRGSLCTWGCHSIQVIFPQN